jgi:hypothetical protein
VPAATPNPFDEDASESIEPVVFAEANLVAAVLKAVVSESTCLAYAEAVTAPVAPVFGPVLVPVVLVVPEVLVGVVLVGVLLTAVATAVVLLCELLLLLLPQALTASTIAPQDSNAVPRRSASEAFNFQFIRLL